jgi:hypothetical protein
MGGIIIGGMSLRRRGISERIGQLVLIIGSSLVGEYSLGYIQ